MKILSKLDNTRMIEEVADKRFVTDEQIANWNSKGVVNIGSFNNTEELITHAVMNQLPTGHYTFIMGIYPYFMLLREEEYYYIGTFQDSEGITVIFEVMKTGVINYLVELDILEALTNLGDFKADTTYVNNGLELKADKTYVDNKVQTDVPSGAKFTDTITTINGKTGTITKADITALGIPAQDTVYSHPSSHPASMITESSTKRFVSDSEKSTWNNKSDTDTVTTINGKTGAISKADIVALGIPAQDTVYTHPTGTNPHGTTKSDVGLSNVDNIKQASKTEFDEHKAEKATQTELGHVKVDGKTISINGEGEISVSNLKPDDDSGSPGDKFLVAGTMEEGFFGEVPASELITGDALASECGISQGTSQFSTEPWLKFAYKDEILFVAKKPIRHSISWDAINAANCVYGDSGDKTVVIGGLTYKVTLMRALEPSNDPKTVSSGHSGAVTHHSEWNRLMCQIHEDAINGSWGSPDNIESDIGILEHSLGSGSQGMYSNADLIVRSGTGRMSWCQEMPGSVSPRLSRGSSDVSHSTAINRVDAYTSQGWRPVLRLVNVKQMPISGGVLENYSEKLVTLSGTSTNIDLSLGNVFTHSLTGNTTYTISNAVSGQAHSFTLIINQTATVRTLTFPASVKWQGGEIPDLSTANKTYVLTFMTIDGGTNWLGMFGGEF